MSDYDRMSMDDLLHELFYILDWGRDRTAIMAALRRKIIKEATVGECDIAFPALGSGKYLLVKKEE